VFFSGERGRKRGRMWGRKAGRSGMVCVLIFLLLSVNNELLAKDQQRDSVTVKAGEEYNRNFIYNFFFGFHHRNLWNTAITVKIANLDSLGLKPIKYGGSRETSSIRFIDTKGREFVGRSVNKDLSKALPLPLRKTFLGKILKDQVSSNHPYAPLVVPNLAKAINIPHATPRLLWLTDNSLKVKQKTDFANNLMMIEERPHSSWKETDLFFNSSKILSSEEFLKKKKNNPELIIDKELYLRERFLDFVIGDWSRHEDQYRWAEVVIDNTKIYKSIPRDRDHAFYKFKDGLLNRIYLAIAPRYQTYDYHLNNIKNFTTAGHLLDTMILQGITIEAWMKIANDVKQKLTDKVIMEAMVNLPPEIYRKCAAELVSKLKSRRDELSLTAYFFYEHINKKKESQERGISFIEEDKFENLNVKSEGFIAQYRLEKSEKSCDRISNIIVSQEVVLAEKLKNYKLTLISGNSVPAQSSLNKQEVKRSLINDISFSFKFILHPNHIWNN